MWWCFGVGEINPCSTKVTALIRSTEIFIMGLWYRAVRLFFRAHGAMEYFSFGILVLLRQLLLKFAALCGQTGDNPSHYRNRRACTHACDVGTGCKYWTGGVMYILVWCVILDRCVELDWCVVCTGLVCCMYWTGVLYVLDWCVVCTGLVCCMYWTGVLYVLDWCVACTGLVCFCTYMASYIPCGLLQN